MFYGIIKHSYLVQIQNGRIIRGSSVALTLLHGARHGLETVDGGMNDFESIIDALELFDLERQRLAVLKDVFVKWPVIYQIFQNWDESYERHKVFILTSYLEAHNYAQKILAK